MAACLSYLSVSENVFQPDKNLELCFYVPLSPLLLDLVNCIRPINVCHKYVNKRR